MSLSLNQAHVPLPSGEGLFGVIQQGLGWAMCTCHNMRLWGEVRLWGEGDVLSFQIFLNSTGLSLPIIFVIVH